MCSVFNRPRPSGFICLSYIFFAAVLLLRFLSSFLFCLLLSFFILFPPSCRDKLESAPGTRKTNCTIYFEWSVLVLSVDSSYYPSRWKASKAKLPLRCVGLLQGLRVVLAWFARTLFVAEPARAPSARLSASCSNRWSRARYADSPLLDPTHPVTEDCLRAAREATRRLYIHHHLSLSLNSIKTRHRTRSGARSLVESCS